MNKSKLPDIRANAPVAFLKEVDEALHAERMQRLWMEWRHAIVVFVTVLLLCTAGWQAYKVWHAKQQDRFATEWYVATTGEAPVIPDNMAKAPQPGLRALAAFGVAQEAMKASPPNVEVAAASYQSVADDRGAEAWLRDWARINGALVQMGAKPDAAKVLLDGLVAKPQSPMHAPALELRAVLAQAEGDTVTAHRLTTQLLALPNLPPQLAVRGKQRLGVLSILPN